MYPTYSTQYTGAAIPTLQEGLVAAKELDMLVFLDIKDADVCKFVAVYSLIVYLGGSVACSWLVGHWLGSCMQ